MVSRIALAISLSLAGVHAADITVTSMGNSGAGTLRQAILDVIDGGTIDFAASGSLQTVTLTSEIVLSKGVTIDASNLPNGLTISGATRLFSVDAGGNLTLRCLTLSGGNGGGVTSSGSGGAIYNAGTTTLERCTLSGNSAVNDGGAIQNALAATLIVTNSTLSGNTSSKNGGAIANFGTLTLDSATVSANTAVTGGAGIYNHVAASLTLNNSIVAGNTPVNILLSCLNISGTWSGSHNLTSGSPGLAALANAGGSTFTMQPNPGSPAIDAGGATALTIDQRGLARVLEVGLDIGACETSVVALPTAVTNALTIFYNPTGLTIYGRLATANSDGTFQISTDSLFRGNVSTYAGKGTAGVLDDALLSSEFNNPSGVAQDSLGNIFIADTSNSRIRMIDAITGAVSTIAGNSFGLANGPGSDARFAFPAALAVGPDDNVYVSDTYNHRICKLERPPSPGAPWTVTSLAGPATQGNDGFNNGSGSVALFKEPYGLTLDGLGNVYVADSGNHRIRKITPSGVVSTYAGSGTPGFVNNSLAASAQFETPRAVAFYNNDVYVADTLNHSIRKIAPNGINAGAVTTVAGLDSTGFVDGTTAARFNTPSGLASDGTGKLYVADENNHAVREVLISTGAVTTVAGTGFPGFVNGLSGASNLVQFRSPTGLLVTRDRPGVPNSGGNLVVADSSNHVLRNININPINVPYSVVSSSSYPGVLVSAVFDPVALGLNPDVTYYFRWASTPANTQTPGTYTSMTLRDFPDVTTVTASNITPTAAQLNATVNANSTSTTVKFEYSTDPDLLNPYEVSAFVGSGVAGFANGTGVASQFSDPSGVVTDACGDVYVADRLNNRIRKITSAGVVSTFAGSGAAGFGEGTGTAAIFERPSGMAMDSKGNFYVADEYNHCIRRITPAGVVDTFAGIGQNAGFEDAARLSAKFRFPRGVAVDSADNIYVADTGNHRIRRIDAVSGDVTTLAGTGGAAFADGGFATASLSSPQALAVTLDGRVLVADTGNHRIRMIESGVVSTLAGSGNGFLDGAGASAQFSSPTGITLDALGVAYVTDQGNHRIRWIATDGVNVVVTTLAGSGLPGSVNSPAASLYPTTACQFDEPTGIGMDTAGTIYITQQGLVRKIARSASLPFMLGTTTPSGSVAVAVSAYTPLTLQYGSTYYFRAKGTNTRGLTSGDILSFVTTQAKILVYDGPSVSDPAILHDQSEELDFGTTPRDQPVTRTFTISNPGSAILNVSSIAVPFGYQLMGPGNFAVSAGGSATFQVELLADTGTVTYPGVVTINCDAHDQTVFSFPVTGLVLNPPVVTTDPVSDTDIGTATFNATVNPQGSDTSVWFEWSVDENFDGVYVTTVTGSAAGFGQPSGIVTDASGNIYVADTNNHRIRKIEPIDVTVLSCVTTISSTTVTCTSTVGLLPNMVIEGSGIAPGTTIASITNATSFVLSQAAVGTSTGNLKAVRLVTTFAGTGVAGYANGAGANAQFNEPVGLAFNDDGVLFVADSKNHRIRAINAVGEVSTYSGAEESIALTGCATTIGGTIVTCADTSAVVAGMYIYGTNIPAGTKISSITNATQLVISTAATANGSGLSFTAVSNYGSFTDGDANAARFHTPMGLAIDGDGVLYVADSVNRRIRKVESDGSVSTLSGTGVAGYGNGLGTVATFTNPKGIAVDSSGSVYVTEAASHAIRKVAASGLTSVFTGSTIGNSDGNPANAKFNLPVGLVVDVDDNLYVADAGNNRIRIVDQGGNVKTLAGTGSAATVDGYGDAPNSAPPILVPVELAQFSSPISLAATASGEVIVGESGSSAIREISSLQVILNPGPVPAGVLDVPVTLVVNGLPTGLMTYFYRAIASNGGGTTTGTSLQSAIVYEYPVVVTEPATPLTPTTATLNATVDPKLSPTQVVFTYSTDPGLLNPYEVKAFAGSGVAGFADNADGALAQFSNPSGVVADAVGNIFVADRENHRIRKITSAGEVTTFAGSGSDAPFELPSGIAIDSAGNLYVADENNHQIRMITSLGVVSTFAGTGEADLLDGPKSTAKFQYPRGVAVDTANNVYVADMGNNRIRRIDAGTGEVTTIGGAVSGDFSSPQALVVMAIDKILVADTGNHRIRMIDAGVISTYAGNGVEGFLDGPGPSAQFASPTGITRDSSGVAYVTDAGNHRIRRIASDGEVTTLAGSGIPGNVNSPTSGLYPATATQFDSPAGICIDASGALFVTQEGLVREIARRAVLPTVTVTPDPTGSGQRPVSASIPELLLHGSTYYFRASGTNGRGATTGAILSFVTPEAKILVFNGPTVTDPAILHNQTLALDFGNTPTGQPVTRSFTISNPGNWPLNVSAVTVPAGGYQLTGGVAIIPALGSATFQVTLSAITAGTHSGNVDISCNAPDALVLGQTIFSFPITGLVLDPPVVTTLAVSNTDIGTATFNATVNPRGSNTQVWFEWSIDENFDGVFVSTVAGSGPGYVNDVGVASKFDKPSGLVTDAAGNIYVADTLNHRIRKIAPDGTTTTFAGTGTPGFANGAGDVAQFNEPVGLAMNASGTLLFVADSKNHRIRAITAAGVVSTFAGLGEAAFTDGLPGSARFDTPLGLAIDGAGVLYVADSANHRIRKVATDGLVSTLSGTGVAGLGNGPGVSAQFTNPVGIAVDSLGNVYVTESASHAIRKVAANGVTSDYAGSRTTADIVNANGTDARFFSPSGLVVGLNDRLYVADAGNHRIRIVESDGDVITIAGIAAAGTVDGYGDIPNDTIHPLATPVTIAQLASPLSLATTAGGGVVVGQSSNSVIRKILPIQVLLEAPPVLTGTLPVLVELQANGLPTGLTTYFYRAIANNGGGNAIGNSRQSAIVYEYPEVVTEAATNLTPISARLNATVDPKFSPATVVFEYSTDPGLLKPYEVSAIAGSATPGFFDSFTAADARFSNPSGVVTDANGNIFVADRQNHRIRRIDASTKEVTTFAGSGVAGFADGTSAAAEFEFPSGIDIDSKGNLYVADEYNHCIRMITPAGAVSTFAGIAEDAGFVDADKAAAKFNYPMGVAVDTSDNVYVADTENHRIRKIAGMVTLPNCATTSSSTTVQCSSTLGLTVGMVIYGPNIAAGTTIVSIVPNTSFVLSQAALATSTFTTFNVGDAVALSNCVTTISNTTVTCFDTTGLVAGMSVIGTNIAPGTTIESIPNLTSFVLSKAAFGTGAVTLNFVPQLELPNCVTTNLSTTVTCTSTSGLVVGMLISGTNIAPGTSIVSILPNTSFELSQAAVGTSTLPTINAGDMVVTTIGGAVPDDFSSPQALVVSTSGKVLVADTGKHRIRMINNGVVSTLAGSGAGGFLDGAGAVAQFASPAGITLDDAGVAYVTDAGNHRIRMVATNGAVTTLAGSGLAGNVNSPPLGLYPATVTRFDTPTGICGDGAGGFILTQEGLVRKIARRATLPSVFTLLTPTGPGDRSVFADITEPLRFGSTYYFRAVVTNDRGTTTGDILNFVTRETKILVFDGNDVSDPAILHNQSTVVDFATTPKNNPVTRSFTISNPGTWLLNVSDVTVPVGYSLDTPTAFPWVIAPLGSFTFDVTLVANSGNTYEGDIVITCDAHDQPDVQPGVSFFSFPITGLVYDPPVLTTLPQSNVSSGSATFHAIVNPRGSSTTVWFEWSLDSEFDGVRVTTIAGSGNDYAEGVSVAAKFNQPSGLVTDAVGNIYVADTQNHRIRRIDAITKAVTTFAGTGVRGFADSPNAQFDEPVGLVMDASGTLFVADSKNHRIRKIAPTGEVTTYCGTGVAEFNDGLAGAAEFNTPLGLAIKSGVLYVADSGNHRIRKVATDGDVSTLAGPLIGTGDPGYVNGPGTDARFTNPVGIALDSLGNIYVTEAASHAIRKVAADGFTSDYVGSRGTAGFVNASGAAARFTNPVGLAVDANDQLHVADSGNHRIRIVDAAGNVITLAGTGTSGALDGYGKPPQFGFGVVAQFVTPISLATKANGSVIVGEAGNSLIRDISSIQTVLLAASDLNGTVDIPVQLTVTGLPLNGTALPPAGTTYFYRSFATNSGGTTIANGRASRVVTFRAWQLNNFGLDAFDPLISGPNASPSGDGVSNLVKYSGGLNPFARVTSPYPGLLLPGDGKLYIDYIQKLYLIDLIYTVQWSTDLVIWNNTGITHQIWSLVHDGNLDDYTNYRSYVPANTPAKFLRLIITAQ